MIGDKVSPTEHKRIFRAEEDFLKAEELEKYLNLLKEAEYDGNIVALKEILGEVVSGFSPENETVDMLSLKQEN